MTDPTVQPRPAAVLAILLFVFGLCPALLIAQTEPADDPPPMRAGRGDFVRPLDVDVHIVDKDGVPVPVLGLKREEAAKLLDLFQNKAADDGGISINGSIDLVAAVDKDKEYCTLEVTYQVRLSQRDESQEVRWVPVPLRLDKAIVDLASVEYKSPADFFLHKDEEGFVAWLHAKPNTEHTIKLQAKIVITETGGTRTLDVKLPNLNTKSRVVIPKRDLTVMRSDGGSFIAKEEIDQQTVVTIDNAGGGVAIGWTEQPAVKPLVEVRGAVRVDVHANHVSAEATLEVRSRGEPINSFVVNLPPEMQLTSQQIPGFQIATSEDPTLKRQAVAVRPVAGPTSGVIKITLRAKAAEMDQVKPNRVLQVAGFDVQEADLQLGTIDVFVRGNWSVTWKPDAFVQPEPSVEAADPTAVASRFLYDRQPFSLQVELQRKQPRVRVSAEYIVHVGETQADLEAMLHYETTGTTAIKLKLADWKVTDAELDGVALSGYEVDGEGVLTIPIAASATVLDILVRGQQPLPTEGDDIAIQLPRPVDPAQPPVATVLVLPADNVELTPRVSEMKWLVEAAVAGESEATPPATPRYAYREELSTDMLEPALFVARKRIRSRTIHANVTTVATLQDAGMIVEEEITLAIAYGTINSLAFDVPANVMAAGTLQFLIDGQPAAHERIEPDADASPDATRVSVDLMSERTGSVVVRAQYGLPAKDITSGNTISIPLLQPTEDSSLTVSSNVLNVNADESTAVALADEGWTTENGAGEQAPAHHQLRLRTPGRSRSAAVRLASVQRRSGRKTSVSRAWLQTVVSGLDRRDRVVFRLVSDEAQLAIQLPASASVQDLKIAINGQDAEFRVAEDRLVRVTQPEMLIGSELALELSYWGDPIDVSRSVLQAALPELQAAERIERVYWEVLLPRNRHLVWAPALVTPELVWRFDDLYWGPKGRLSQRELEELLGASAQDVPENMNRYLFSGTGAVSAIRYTVVSRLALMLIFSAIALLAVVPFFYLASLRQPPAYIAIGFVLTAMAVTFPEPAVMFGQAGAIGIALALVACVLRRVIGPQQAVPLPRGRINVAPDSQQLSGAVFSEGSSRATTATAPAHLKVARVEAEP